ncbi:MAG TPA: chemotaxis protein CheW [Anaeromyxobacteraceae bacterium]|nr:chemotaxis protein CheW [Anaeromyxobacteraceae bacterium]
MDPRHVVFRSGGERFALPLEAVSEVVNPQPPYARVPRAGASVRGAMNLRGRVVAVVELAPLLGLAAESLPDGQGQVLVIDRERRGLGFLVDGVLGVEPLGPIERPGESPPVRGLASVREAPVSVLDPDALCEAAHRLFGGKAEAP